MLCNSDAGDKNSETKNREKIYIYAGLELGYICGYSFIIVRTQSKDEIKVNLYFYITAHESKFWMEQNKAISDYMAESNLQETSTH